jgi:hypothetical protein
MELASECMSLLALPQTDPVLQEDDTKDGKDGTGTGIGIGTGTIPKEVPLPRGPNRSAAFASNAEQYFETLNVSVISLAVFPYSHVAYCSTRRLRRFAFVYRFWLDIAFHRSRHPIQYHTPGVIASAYRLLFFAYLWGPNLPVLVLVLRSHLLRIISTILTGCWVCLILGTYIMVFEHRY